MSAWTATSHGPRYLVLMYLGCPRTSGRPREDFGWLTYIYILIVKMSVTSPLYFAIGGADPRPPPAVSGMTTLADGAIRLTLDRIEKRVMDERGRSRHGAGLRRNPKVDRPSFQICTCGDETFKFVTLKPQHSTPLGPLGTVTTITNSSLLRARLRTYVRDVRSQVRDCE